jgi:hypothetical protein
MKYRDTEAARAPEGGTFLNVPNGTERQTTLPKRSVTVGINAQ